MSNALTAMAAQQASDIATQPAGVAATTQQAFQHVAPFLSLDSQGNAQSSSGSLQATCEGLALQQQTQQLLNQWPQLVHQPQPQQITPAQLIQYIHANNELAPTARGNHNLISSSTSQQQPLPQTGPFVPVLSLPAQQQQTSQANTGTLYQQLQSSLQQQQQQQQPTNSNQLTSVASNNLAVLQQFLNQKQQK